MSKRKAPARNPLPDMERMMKEVQRLIGSQNFSSIEETNAFLNEQLQSGSLDPGKLPGPDANASALDRAQEMIWDACEAPTHKKAIALAKKALKISKDCADAWVFLAENEADSHQAALFLYEQGIQAGERALGPEAFESYRGVFWGAHETRPYMRARAGLGKTLWMLGRHEESVAHWEAMLELNPHDNQGIRELLFASYLMEEMLPEAAALLKKFPNDASCDMVYGTVLLEWMRGDKEASRTAMKKALKGNPHVVEFLLGRKSLPKDPPDMIAWGGESEAAEHVRGWCSLWAEYPDAIAALAKVAKVPTS